MVVAVSTPVWVALIGVISVIITGLAAPALAARFLKPASASELVDSALKIVERYEKGEADFEARLAKIEKQLGEATRKITQLTTERDTALRREREALERERVAIDNERRAKSVADDLAVRLSAAESRIAELEKRVS